MTTEGKPKLQMGDDTRYMYKKPNNRRLLIICVLSLLCCIGLLLAVIILAVYSTKRSPEVCSTPHCVMTAGKILETIDAKIDPCDNFVDFACGGFFKRNVIPEDQSTYSSFDMLYVKLQITLKELFEREASSEDILVERKVKDYYGSCVDLDVIEERDAKPLLTLLHDLGGWPALADNFGGREDYSDVDFETLMGRLAGEFFITSLVSAAVRIDDKNSSRHVLEIDQPYLGMRSRDYYLDEQYAHYKKAYLNYMVAVASLLGASEELNPEYEMQAVLDLETRIANLTIPSEERRDDEAMYNPTSIGELNESLPQIDWLKFFDVLMPSETKPLSLTERVINHSPVYLTKAVQLMFVETQPRVVVNYFLWKLIMDHVSNLSKRFRDAQQEYYKVMYGIKSVSARWKKCVGDINMRMAFATGRMYVADNFHGDSKPNVEKMMANLKKAFKEMLEYNEWMDEETKVVAREKCDAVSVQVGYPDWIMDDDVINEYYAKLEVVPDKFFENNLNDIRWAAHQNLVKLRKPVDEDEWYVGPAVVNAFYRASNNVIVFPAGILQPPFYHDDSPWYLNYGGIGMVIGHEITHGFDDRGRQYDKDGNLRQWWSDRSIENFKDRTQCIIEQYNGYVMPENNKSLNGKRTQGENIADNGGLKEAFKAYMENEYSNIKLPGLTEYSPEQLFYLNYAQVWCALFRLEVVDKAVTTWVHSLPRYRIIGPIHNSYGFEKAFNCPKGSYMNLPSEEKCSIW